MDWLSLLIVVFVGLTGVVGLRQGLIRQVLGLAGLIAAVVLAFQHYDRAGAVFQNYLVISRGMANILGFVAICVGVAVAVWIVELVWSRLVRYTPVSALDAIGGALFGLLKGSVIVAVVLLVLHALPSEGVRRVLAGSTLAREFLNASPRIYDRIEDVLPAGVPRFIDRGKDANNNRVSDGDRAAGGNKV